MVLQEGFTAEQASRLTGCTSSQLRYWDSVRLVQPSIQKTGGRPGVRRVYSFRDLVQLRAVRSLKDNGMSLQRIRRAWGYLSRNGVDPRAVKLATDGVSVFQVAQDDDAIIDILREGQLAFFVALDEITCNVEEDVTRFELERDKFLSVVRSTREEVDRRIAGASG
ncbi:MAG: helix-turn-helix domain-containing protein [bacterium]|nr:helix-turn-helix domain-containing protein [bacterium]MDE0287381.1 helix-turn-helix domain-containing protein [bacterium]MDE0438384.1 helix-turn-helix domain-containing protein [bacterium]